MKQLEKVHAIIGCANAAYEEALKNADRDTLNVCGTVRVCGLSLLESARMAGDSNSYFFDGVVIGKVHFFEQLAILMMYHLNKDEIEAFSVDAAGLLKEAKGGE